MNLGNNDKEFWVYIQQENGLADRASMDVLAKAQSLLDGRKEYLLCAAAFGPRAGAAAQSLAALGVGKVYVGESDELVAADHLACADALMPLIEKHLPEVLLFSGSKSAGLIAAILGARLRTGVIAHSVDISLNGSGKLTGVVPAFGGQMLGDILCPFTFPQIATVRAGRMDFVPQDKRGEIIAVELPKKPAGGKGLQLLETACDETCEGIPLAEAGIVVCGGLGIGSRENWQNVEQLARLLGAAVGCTRPPVDEDWGADEHMMIGTSGNSVRPDVYLGFGVSGTTHHVCGMKESKVVFHINKDENAPAFSVSDFGFVGDTQEILPLLIQEIIAAKSKA